MESSTEDNQIHRTVLEDHQMLDYNMMILDSSIGYFLSFEMIKESSCYT